MTQHEKKSSAKEHVIVGAGVGVAGAANTIGLIGLSRLPIAIVVGAVGGLAWSVRTIGKDS